MNILNIGFGNIGVRHASNLKTLGHTIRVYDISEASRKRASEEGYCIYSTLEEALASQPEIVMICTDTSSHISVAQTVLTSNNNMLKGIFIEKPFSYNLDGVFTIKNMCDERNIKLMTGCNLRFAQGIHLIETLLNNKAIGKVYACHYFFGHDLKQWHPDTDYTLSYSAGSNGGILLDDIHACDLMLHLFNNILDIKGYLSHTNTLKTQNEEIADYILSCGDKINHNEVLCHIHSDYLLPDYTRTLEIFGTGGIINLDFKEGFVSLKTPAIPEWRSFNVLEPLNEIYIRELNHFIGCIEHNIEPISNGIEALKWICELKKQNESSKA